jgi:hypothetical protein
MNVWELLAYNHVAINLYWKSFQCSAMFMHEFVFVPTLPGEKSVMHRTALCKNNVCNMALDLLGRSN